MATKMREHRNQAGYDAMQLAPEASQVSEMKILTVIAIIQIAAILLLYSKIVEIDGTLGRPLVAAQKAAISGDPGHATISADIFGSNSYPNEDRIRQIIREELAAQLDQQTGPAVAGDPVTMAVAREPAEIERQREQVFQQLEYFTSVGRISDMEMHKLQRDIAKLDAASRTAALGELVRAINLGRLEGRL